MDILETMKKFVRELLLLVTIYVITIFLTHINDMTKTETILNAFEILISVGQIFTKGDINRAAQKQDPNINSATVRWTISNKLEKTGRIKKVGKGAHDANLYQKTK